jgi:putative phosphoesterase
MTLLGLIADIHGDWKGFLQAVQLFTHLGVRHIVCAGDIVDRGADADRIVAALQRLPATCVKGNHEHTIARAQARWRVSPRADRLAQVGRVISDATLAFISALPPTAQLTIDGVRILVAHGTPWSDLADLFPDSRQAKYDQLLQQYGATTDVVVLGHTHQPMHVRLGHLQILNPGSVYGVTGRDSHTCATLSLPERDVRVFDLRTNAPYPLPVVSR